MRGRRFFKPSFALTPSGSTALFTLQDLENAYEWIFKLRKKYSHNSDIWELCRTWNQIKHSLFESLNDGSYHFSSLERLEFKDGTLSLWTSQDMIALKLITQALEGRIGFAIPKSCYHVKDHGGLKHAVRETHRALPHHHFVMRSDIKSYYQSIDFKSLMSIIETYIKHPVLLTLIYKACRRTETRGGIFHDYNERGIPKGSPLSPLLGAIALMPLDQEMGRIKDVFYARFMDDWVVLTKSKTALRKVIKRTHQIINSQKLHLHPMKTYIGKIRQGFNFLGYYFDDKKILPAKETIRRFHERAAALYERPQKNITSQRYMKSLNTRDISLYQVDEPAPKDEDFKNILFPLLAASKQPERLKRLRKYIDQWTCWLKLGLTMIKELETCVHAFLPSLFSHWSAGAQTKSSGVSR